MVIEEFLNKNMFKKLNKNEVLSFINQIEQEKNIDLNSYKEKITEKTNKKIYELVYYGYSENWAIEYNEEVIIDSEVLENEEDIL